MTAALRKRIYPDNPELSELARDVDQALGAVPPTRLVTLTDIYAEPMTLRFAEFPVEAILAVDVREDASPDEAIPVSSPVNFTRIKDGARINSIEGPTLGTKYRFKLLVIGRQEGG